MSQQAKTIQHKFEKKNYKLQITLFNKHKENNTYLLLHELFSECGFIIHFQTHQTTKGILYIPIFIFRIMCVF